MGGALGSNLQLGGFGNPMGFTPPQPKSMFESSAEQFSRLPEQPSRPSDLFSTAVPAFPAQLAQPMGQPAMDLRSTPSMAPTTDAITAFGEPQKSTTLRISNQYGTGSTTLTPEQQTARFQSRQEAEQKGTLPRTPEQQQALLAQMRERGSAIRERIASSKIETPASPASSTLNNSVLAATGFGAMQRNQDTQTPPSIRSQSLFGGMGYASAFGVGQPQPAQGMVSRATPSVPQFPTKTTAWQGNTTQRSWDNYVGPNPIESRVGTPFYDRSPRYGRRS